VTEEEARARVAVARVARLASIDRNGRPHVVPICFAIADDRIVSVVDDKPKRTTELRRLDNVREHPDVQLVVDHYDEDWSALWWVRISGRAHVVERDNAREPAIDLLAAKYRHYRDHRPSGPLLVIEISTISSWEAASA
jgi:PPOX class probable F420-dependent enzyme